MFEEEKQTVQRNGENHTRSLSFAILGSLAIYILFFALELSGSIHSLNIIVSAEKAMALSGLALISIFLIVETLSKHVSRFKQISPAARRMGAIGFIFAILHGAAVLFVLTNTYQPAWLDQQFVSITAAKVAIVFFAITFAASIGFFASRLGEKKWLLAQITGYMGLIFVMLHVLYMAKPNYYNLGTSILSALKQSEAAFILIFLALVILLKIFTAFLNKRFSLQAKVIAHTFIFLSLSAITIMAYIITSDLSSHKEDVFHHNHHMADYILMQIQANSNISIENYYGVGDDITKSADGVPTVFFIDNHGEIVHYPGKTKEGTPYGAFAAKKPSADGMGWEVEYKDAGDTMLDTITSLGSGNGYLVASTDFTKAEMGHFDSEILHSSLLIVFVTLVTGGMTILFTRQNILTPIRRITDASKKLSEGNFDAKINVKGEDEFATLADIFSNMAARMKGQINDLMKMDKLKNEFISIASHNLRTPLATLRGYLDMLRLETQGKLNRGQKDTLKKADHSATSLASLIEGLVNITSLESAGLKIEKEEINLRVLIEKVIEELVPLANEKKITVKNDIGSEDIMAIGDQAKLKQAFLAVMENAIKFNKQEGNILIEKIIDDTKQATIGRREVIITIKDTGIGIAKGEKENVFQKFNRGTSTYTYEYEGVGLGLYLARLIMQAHRGKIWFESEENKGTTFYISLPAK